MAGTSRHYWEPPTTAVPLNRAEIFLTMKEGLRVLRGRPTRGQQNTLRLRLMFRPFRGSLQERRRATAGTGGSPKQQNGSRRGGMRRRRRAQGRATHALGCRWTENGGRGRGGSSKHQAGSWSGGTRRRRRRAARATHPSWAAERGGGGGQQN